LTKAPSMPQRLDLSLPPLEHRITRSSAQVRTRRVMTVFVLRER
jgi:hypothetical protein